MMDFNKSCSTYKYENETFVTKCNEDGPNYLDAFLLNGEYSIKRVIRNEVAGERDLAEALFCKAIYTVGNVLYKKNESSVWKFIALMVKATYQKCLSEEVDTSVASRRKLEGGTICPTRDVIFSYDGATFTVIGRYIYGYDYNYLKFSKKTSTDKEIKLKVNSLTTVEKKKEKKNNLKATPISENELTIEDINVDVPVNEIDEKENNDDSNESNEDSNDSDEKNEDSNDSDEKNEDSEHKDHIPNAKLSKNEIILPTVAWNFCNRAQDYNYSFMIVDNKTKELIAFGLYR